MSFNNIADFLNAIYQQREHITGALVAIEYDWISLSELPRADGPVQLGGERTISDIVTSAYYRKAELSVRTLHYLYSKFEDELQGLYAKARIGTESVPPHLRESWLKMLESLEGAHLKLLNDTLTQSHRVSSYTSLPEQEFATIGCYDLQNHNLYKKARRELAEFQNTRNPLDERLVCGDTFNLWSINNFLNTLDRQRQRITDALTAYQHAIEIRDDYHAADWLAFADCLRYQFVGESGFHLSAALSATEAMHPTLGGQWRRTLNKLNDSHRELLGSPLRDGAERVDWHLQKVDNSELVEDARLKFTALQKDLALQQDEEPESEAAGSSKPTTTVDLAIGADLDDPKGNGMSVEEANERAMNVAKENGKAFFVMSKRKQAKMIGCHHLTWGRTPFYLQAVADGRIAPAKPKAAKAVSLTPALEAATGVGEKDETQKIAAEREIGRLIAEQNADAEPSPLTNDPTSRERKVHTRKRL